MLVTDDKCLVLLARKPRSKWYYIACFGRKRHYRKDGTCKHTDQLLAQIKPDLLPRVKVDAFGGRPENAG